MVIAYCLLPLDRLGRRHPTASWALLIAALTVIALLLLWQIRSVLTDRDVAHPALVIPLLVCLSVLVFSAAYYVLAVPHGHKGTSGAALSDEVRGLHTRLDAVYFTLVTLATIGYGDIAPIGQTARLVAILQILYSFVFLTAATTALGRYVRRRLGERADEPRANDR